MYSEEDVKRMRIISILLEEQEKLLREEINEHQNKLNTINNKVVKNLPFAVFAFYLVGVWLVSVVYLASSLLQTASTVMINLMSSGELFHVIFTLIVFDRRRI